MIMMGHLLAYGSFTDIKIESGEDCLYEIFKKQQKTKIIYIN